MSSHMTIQSFAMEIQMSVECLIKQFLNIGITKTKFDFVTQSERDILLRYMHCHNIAIFDEFSLQRKTHSTLNVFSLGGKNKKIRVEVRKKRTYMVQSPTKKIDSFDNIQNISKNKTESNIGCNKSVNVIKKNSLTINNNIDSTVFLNTISEKADLFHSDIIKRKDTFDMQISCKNTNTVSKHLSYKESKSNNQKYEISKYDIKDINNINKSKINDVNKSDHVSILKIKNNNYKLENERQHNSRTRSRYKIIGKTIRQKRNNNHRSYIDSADEGLCTEEKICSINYLNKNKRKQSVLVHRFNKPLQIVSRNIVIGKSISVLELSNKMSVKSSYMIEMMMKLGLIVTINQIIDQETAQLVIEEMGHHAILRHSNELESLVGDKCYNENIDNTSINVKDVSVYKIRPPIVTIMGHVDHGKTSLLDCIRSINTVDAEFGGITQNIRSYYVKTKNGNAITFLDTPGHEAFFKMRMRGAQLTDIIVLVIAADDGIMPQTVESIQHIQSDNIPVIVAINKIDKISTHVDSIKHALNKYGLIPEEWGGNVQFINVSARSGFGVNDLLDAILLQAEVLELKTIHYGPAKGIIIDGFLDKGRGPVVTALVREGELKCGDIVLCGAEYGRVKVMRDEFGHNIVTAGPSIPVELLGLSGIPDSGETMIVLQNEKKAKELSLYRQNKKREIKLARKQEEHSAKRFFNKINSVDKVTDLNFIVKSDTQGSIEAIYEALQKLSTPEIAIKILFSSIGNITETDSVLASTSNSIILAFNVKADSSARRVIESSNLRIYYSSIIYDLLNEVKRIINNILIPKNEYKIVGIAEVHNIFRSLKYGTIAGCLVIDGIIKLHKKTKLIRNNIVIHEGELESLRHFKSDVNEVKSGIECGIAIKNYHDICSGDIIKVFDRFDVSNSLNI